MSKPCSFFASNRCKNGSSCPFTHETNNSSKNPFVTGHRRNSTTSSAQSWTSRSKIPCEYYADGRCNKGTSCLFLHEKAEAVVYQPTIIPIVGKTTHTYTEEKKDPRAAIPCRYAATGDCTKGDWCPFLHDEQILKTVDAGVDVRAENNVIENNTDSRACIPCKYFSNGSCREGQLCVYSHAEGSQNSGDVEIEPAEENINPTRELSGATATFTDGAKITKVTLPCDFSAVRLSGLPSTSSSKSVAACLGELGFDIDVKNIRLIKNEKQSGCNAFVKVDDPNFAKNLCEILSTEKTRSTKNSLQTTNTLEAIPIPISTPATTHNIDCRKVHCSWHKSSKTVWLNFQDGDNGSVLSDNDIPKRIHYGFKSGRYRVLGQQVECNDEPKFDRTINNIRRGWTRLGPITWTVTLTGVPGNATERDITRQLPRNDRPNHVELGSAGYSISKQKAIDSVKLLLSDIGPLDWWKADESTNTTGKRIKASARFEEEADARQAMRSLNNKVPIFFNNTKLTVQLVFSAKFKIATVQYDAIREQIYKASALWRTQHINFSTFRNTDALKRFTVIKIEGEDETLILSAKDVLDSLLGGVVVKDSDGKPVWSPNLTTNGMIQKLKKVEQKNGIVIVRNKRKCHLQLYGSPEACQRTAREVIELVKAESDDAHVIELDAKTFSWALNGGIRTLVSALGDDIVAFDIISKPRKIRISGSRKNYDIAIGLINSNTTTATTNRTPSTINSNDKTCPICTSDAENPVNTVCGHTYCLDCFENLCSSADADDNGFNIHCFGNNGRCASVFTLAELQEHLSSTAFEGILESSFDGYVRHRLTALRYCPTPSCNLIYRVSASNTATATAIAYKCPSCKETTCSSCHNPYIGTTCVDHNYHASGGKEEFSRYKKEHGIKDCRKCNAPMEKTEGCDHMQCGVCGIHICWVCMETFSVSSACYDHMNRVHGGIGLEFDLI